MDINYTNARDDQILVIHANDSKLIPGRRAVKMESTLLKMFMNLKPNPIFIIDMA